MKQNAIVPYLLARYLGLNKVIIKKASIFSYSPLIFIFFWKKTLRPYKLVIKTCKTDHDTVNFQEDFDMVHWANCSFSAITCEIAAKEIKVNWFSLLKARRAFKNYVNKWLSEALSEYAQNILHIAWMSIWLTKRQAISTDALLGTYTITK